MLPVLALALTHLVVGAAQAPAAPAFPAASAPQSLPTSGSGELICLPKGHEPVLAALKGTRVDANIQGFGARVSLVQTFRNPSSSPVEAIYTFPLPHDAAVDRMRIQVGDRIIEGELKRRDDARAIYEAAKYAGQTAAILDQENDNVFTQSVANLMPGDEVKVEISYVQLLKYEGGQFEFSYPMVVGPRYIGSSTPNPDKISPPYAPKGTRSGADISLHVRLDAGAPIQSVNSVLHKVSVQRNRNGVAEIELTKRDEIPNRDFILRYAVATDAIQSAFLTHYEPERGGYFSLVLLPPARPAATVVQPKELVFVMDQSGSQGGFPLAKSKELTEKLIERMGPGDTFNVLGFSDNVTRLWPGPRPNTAENRKVALDFVRKMEVTGGTELQKAVLAALSPQPDPQRVRYVVFNTDAFVGQEKEILDDIRRYRGNSRMFVFGIGNGVNRSLVDAMSLEGRGDSEVVTLAEAADGAVERFLQRSGNPILTNVTVTGEGVSDFLPAALPDVLADKPIVLFGRYSQPGRGRLELSGNYGGKPWHKTIDVNLPAKNDDADAVMRLWGRRRIADIGRTVFDGGESNETLKGRITKVALDYGILSPYTSFVAVEKRVVNVGGKARTVRVPVDMTDGVSLSDGGGATRSLPAASQWQLNRAGLAAAPGGLSGGFASGGASVRLTDKAPADRAKEVDASAFKISPELNGKKGVLHVQIKLADLSEAAIQKLKECGFKLDAKLEDLRVVLGTIDAEELKKLAKLTEVVAILPDSN